MEKLSNQTSENDYVYNRKNEQSTINYVYVKDFTSYFPGRKLPQDDNFVKTKIIESLKPAFILAQLCGFLPLKVSWGLDLSQYSFSWTNFQAIYTIASFIIILFIFYATVHWISKTHEFNIFVSEYLVTKFSVLLGFLGFFRFAKRWPKISKQWKELERRLPSYENDDSCYKLGRRVYTVLIIACFCNLVQNLLEIGSTIIHIKYCVKNDVNLLEAYVKLTFTHTFNLIDYYSDFLGVFLIVILLQLRFCIVFAHIFLIVFANCLTNNFERLNNRLELVKGKKTEELFWVEQRKLYKDICNLCAEVDEALSVITIISSGVSLYKLTLHVLKAFILVSHPLRGCYYLSSILFGFWYLLSKALSSSQIGDESKRPLRVLRCVPPECWCMETKMFADEVSDAEVELSGCRFFYLNRGMLLRALAFIITYELVLLQYNVNESKEPNCGVHWS